MLKTITRSEIKESIILLVFAGLLNEILRTPTMLFVLVGAVLVWLKIRPTKVVRNIFTVAVFGTYWFLYGKFIDPEVGLNFLTTIIVLKLLEKESRRDSYMIFFGLLLLISAGSLFEKNLSYVFFFAVSFFILIEDFYRGLKLPGRIKDLSLATLWVLPLTILLFFFVPRMINPFNLDQGGTKKGEVGYTPEVNISEVESLAYNDRPVLQATLSSPVPQEALYWRGNTLSFTDGWNWPLMPGDRYSVRFTQDKNQPSSGIKQKIRTFSRQDFYFGLDYPELYSTGRGVVYLDQTRSLTQSRWQGFLRYEVVSSDAFISASPSDLSTYLRSPLKARDKEWIHTHFQSRDLSGLEKEIQDYFHKELFSYSLSPGKIKSFREFMESKKVGFCSHYASAVAMILRTKGIHSRLVSGFMGGSYNRFAGFYLVNQNDAHVWVEAFDEGRWKRLDPTGWIAPDRVKLGGEAFMNQVEGQNLSPVRFLGNRFSWINDFRQWFDQWDFRFYQLLEEMDYYGQSALLDQLQFRREWIFSLLPLLLALFMGLYAWRLGREGANKKTEIETLWKLFQRKLKARGLTSHFHSLREMEEALNGHQGKDKTEVLRIWADLVQASYAEETQSLKELKMKISRL